MESYSTLSNHHKNALNNFKLFFSSLNIYQTIQLHSSFGSRQIGSNKSMKKVLLSIVQLGW